MLGLGGKIISSRGNLIIQNLGTVRSDGAWHVYFVDSKILFSTDDPAPSCRLPRQETSLRPGRADLLKIAAQQPVPIDFTNQCRFGQMKCRARRGPGNGVEEPRKECFGSLPDSNLIVLRSHFASRSLVAQHSSGCRLSRTEAVVALQLHQGVKRDARLSL